MMNVVDWAANIFRADNLEDKLSKAKLITDFSYREIEVDLRTPGRGQALKFSVQKNKFPKVSHFADPVNRAKAIAFFANHELEAIEMMCAAIIKFGKHKSEHEFEKIVRGIVSSISDEQRHLLMYLNRIRDLGFSPDDYQVNDFFWKQFKKIKCFDEFFSMMSLTFEAANLDFCLYYENVFKKIDDLNSARMMKEVYLDELKHVRLGVYWLNKWREDDSLWNYYLKNLPEGVTPERSKGIGFCRKSRKSAGLDDLFISSLQNHRDDFLIPKRKINYNVSPN